MAVAKQSHATGLKAAEMVTRFAEIVGATRAGADYYGEERKDGRTTAEVVAYLSEGGRSLYPNEADQNAAMNEFANELVRQMDRIADRTTAGDLERYTRAGIVGGLRKGAKFLSQAMGRKLATKTTTTGAPAKKVTDDYAKQRKRKFGIAESSIFVASRQLANGILKGIIKIRFDSAGIGKALRAIRRK